MNRVIKWCRGQPVLIIAFLSAVITMFIVPPDSGYLAYCNTSVLILLFCLMLAVAGLRSVGVFEKITDILLKRSGNIRRLGLIMMNLCFFSAMLVTNDVALLTFVPLTLQLFEGSNDDRSLIRIIVLETAAANLGSMLTPVGNPQNLYIYSEYGLTASEFVSAMLPAGIVSYGILTGLSFGMLDKSPCRTSVGHEISDIPKGRAIGYFAVFLLCIASVLRLIPDWACLVISAAAVLVLDRKLLAKVDYALLGTFVCFFVFVGNIARITAVRDFFSEILAGRELFISALLSQVISNVPAAVMLSGFTENAKALLLGVNIGGLGTPIASLASLISYQFYNKSEGACTGKYLRVFLAVNFGMLAFLLIFEMLMLKIFPI
ncbi:MAG: SLC13 family permease [Oscillospiraceae bacterium]